MYQVLQRQEIILYPGWTVFFMAFQKIDEEFYEELEETLIMGDLGVHSTMEILEDLRAKSKRKTYQRTD